MRFAFFTLPLLIAACGDDDSPPPPADGGTSGPPATSIGSGSIEGPGSFPVSSVTWKDPGPFTEKARVEIRLSDDAACGRKTGCTPTFKQLFLRLSSPPGGTITAGHYSIIADPDAGITGGLEVRSEYQDTNGCRAGDQPGRQGDVTLESITEAELKGTFTVDIYESSGTMSHRTGRFDALKCP